MVYYPNREAYVNLECGCVMLNWGSIEYIGERWKKGNLKGKRIRRMTCERHPSERGQGITGKASPADIIAYIDTPVQEILEGL
jgi:hypothetical protein